MLISSSQKPDRKQIIWEYFPKDFWDSVRLLDCASGDGRKGAQFYINHGVYPSNITAVDVSQELLNVLSFVGVETYCLDLNKVKLQNEIKKYFNLIICAETLEHLKNQERANRLINSFLTMLKTGGHLVLTFPVKAVIKSNATHLYQPDILVFLKRLLSKFECVEMRKYPQTYMLFCTGKNETFD